MHTRNTRRRPFIQIQQLVGSGSATRFRQPGSLRESSIKQTLETYVSHKLTQECRRLENRVSKLYQAPCFGQTSMFQAHRDVHAQEPRTMTREPLDRRGQILSECTVCVPPLKNTLKPSKSTRRESPVSSQLEPRETQRQLSQRRPPTNTRNFLFFQLSLSSHCSHDPRNYMFFLNSQSKLLLLHGRVILALCTSDSQVKC